MSLRALFELEPHGPDTYVGTGLHYPWGGLYGGHIVAQALRAAASTVEADLVPHSLRAYFIRRGDHAEPVRYEVDRIRNGRSFATRRVVARQAIGAILNLEASFQRPEQTADVETVRIPADIPGPDEVAGESWSEFFERRFLPGRHRPDDARTGAGRATAWKKVSEALGPPDDPTAQLVHRCALAYLSDDLPTDAVLRAHPSFADADGGAQFYPASLDHTIWFHREVQADRWHLHDFTCHGYVGGRGLAIGHVFTGAGIHVATVAQEVLLREKR